MCGKTDRNAAHRRNRFRGAEKQDALSRRLEDRSPSLAPFALIESRAHALVEAATFPFLGDIGRFLPNRKDLGNGKDGNNEKVASKICAVAANGLNYRLFLLARRA